MIGREPLFKKRGNDNRNGLSFRDGKIDTLSGVNKGISVVCMSRIRAVLVFIKTAFRPFFTAVTGTWSSIPSDAFES